MKLSKVILPFTFVLALGSVSFGEDTPMEKEMSGLNKAYKALKKTVEDPAAKADNLKLIAEIKKAAEASTKMDPKTAADQPAAQKGAFLEKFRSQMAEFVKAIETLEAAVNAGDAAASKAAFDKLNEMKKKGHEDFKKE